MRLLCLLTDASPPLDLRSVEAMLRAHFAGDPDLWISRDRVNSPSGRDYLRLAWPGPYFVLMYLEDEDDGDGREEAQYAALCAEDEDRRGELLDASRWIRVHFSDLSSPPRTDLLDDVIQCMRRIPGSAIFDADASGFLSR